MRNKKVITTDEDDEDDIDAFIDDDDDETNPRTSVMALGLGNNTAFRPSVK